MRTDEMVEEWDWGRSVVRKGGREFEYTMGGAAEEEWREEEGQEEETAEEQNEEEDEDKEKVD